MHNKRLKNLLKASTENALEASRSRIPRFYSFVVGGNMVKIPIVPPTYIDKEEYLKTEDNIPFVEVREKNYQWLHEFSSKIVQDGHDPSVPLRNFDLDVQNPGISAFRLYTEPDEETGKEDLMQVQVHRIPEKPWLFQLDYFELENDKMVNKFIGVCDMSDKKMTIYDMVINRSTLPYQSAMEVIHKITCLFRDILIYMRIWAYDDPKNSKLCEVLPLYSAFSA